MFWLRNKKNNFQLHTLIWGPGFGSIECLNQITQAGNAILNKIVPYHAAPRSSLARGYLFFLNFVCSVLFRT